MNWFVRQGDVILTRISEKEFEAKTASAPEAPLTEQGELVFALGERTGHRHRFAGLRRDQGEKAFRMGRLEEGTTHYVALRGSRSLLHEEHAPIEIPAGTYKVSIQRQYSPGRNLNVSD